VAPLFKNSARRGGRAKKRVHHKPSIENSTEKKKIRRKKKKDGITLGNRSLPKKRRVGKEERRFESSPKKQVGKRSKKVHQKRKALPGGKRSERKPHVGGAGKTDPLKKYVKRVDQKPRGEEPPGHKKWY